MHRLPTRHSSLATSPPSWFRKTIQVLFFPHFPPSTSSVNPPLSPSTETSLPPASYIYNTSSLSSSSFPCPKQYPTVTRPLLHFIFPSGRYCCSGGVGGGGGGTASSSWSTSWWLRWLPLALVLVLWCGGFAALVYFQLYACVAQNPQTGQVESVEAASATSAYWKWKSQCGLKGERCRPFDNYTELQRCAALPYATKTLQERFVGLQRIMEVPVLVGGAKGIYRGDSWLCSAAVESRRISSALGGCVMVKLLGNRTSFPLASKSTRSPFSVPFSSFFPLAYEVHTCPQAWGCLDVTWFALVFQWLFWILLLASLPRGSPTWLSWWLFMVAAFWHVILISDVQRSFEEFLAEAWTHFVPYLAICYVIYTFVSSTLLVTTRRALLLDMTLFIVTPWIAGFHFNLLSMLFPTFTFTVIGFHEKWPYFLLFSGLLVFMMVYFSYHQRTFHKLHVYLAGYAVFFGLFFGLAAVLKMSPHLHHYMVALMVLPVTRHVQTRFGWVLHFFLLGMFLHGVARWGVDGPYDTQQEGLRGRDDSEALRIRWNTTSFEAYGHAQTVPLQWAPSKFPSTRYRVLANDMLMEQSNASSIAVDKLFDVWKTDYVFLRVSVNQTEVYSKPIQVFRNGTVDHHLLKDEEKVS